MRLRSILAPHCVLEDSQAQDKWEFLKLVSVWLAMDTGLGPEDIEAALVERERMGSTAMGQGVALPHARLPLLERMYVGAVRSLKGLDFEAPDQQPVHIIFVVLAPEHETAVYLRCLSSLARILREESFRKAFLAAPNKDELLKVIYQFDREF